MRHRGLAAAAAAIAAFAAAPSAANAATIDIGKLISISVDIGAGAANAAAKDASRVVVNAAAMAQCGTTQDRVWQAFLKFGDKADYWFAPGGDFEGSTSGWRLENAKVVAGNDQSGVAGGSKSLALGGGLVSLRGTAVSPTFCITEEHPTFRYTLKANGTLGILQTYVRYTATDGSTQEQLVPSNSATNLLPGKWKPSDLQPLATALPMKKIGGVAKVQLVFRSPLGALGSGYQIDNVLVDPYRTR